MSTKGRQVRLFLVDGTPGDLMTAEIMGWTGHILKGKREHLKRIKNREEARRTGVYFLLGTDDDDQPLAYIGQSDEIARRLDSHSREKDFWTEVLVFTSEDMNLTSAMFASLKHGSLSLRRR